MKKAAFLALIVCGLVASFLVGSSLSQTPVKPDQTGFGDTLDFDEAQEEAVQVPDVDVQVEPFARPQSEADKLRNRIMALFKQRLQKMSDDELKEMLAQNQEELKERIAAEKLQQAQGLLKEVVKEFPRSQAAKQAERMLQVHMRKFFPDGEGEGAVPNESLMLEPFGPVPQRSEE